MQVRKQQMKALEDILPAPVKAPAGVKGMETEDDIPYLPVSSPRVRPVLMTQA